MSIGVQKDVLLGIIRIYLKTNINLSWSEENYDLEVCKVYGYIVIKQKVSICCCMHNPLHLSIFPLPCQEIFLPSNCEENTVTTFSTVLSECPWLNDGLKKENLGLNLIHNDSWLFEEYPFRFPEEPHCFCGEVF